MYIIIRCNWLQWRKAITLEIKDNREINKLEELYIKRQTEYKNFKCIACLKIDRLCIEMIIVTITKTKIKMYVSKSSK